jgi:predicted ATPase/class 3 adenylate cyclase
MQTPSGAREAALQNVVNELRASRFAAEGERKQVTILFADMRGSMQMIHGRDPELALQQLDPALQAMTTAVRRYGGLVNRVQGDGIMALFGAPIATEDHAIRACRAARAMLDAVALLEDDGLQIRVGMSSGEVVLHPVGTDIALGYDATGPDAHLAHRIEQIAAPGTAYLAPRTNRLAGGFIHARSRGEFAIKGIDRPVELFELMSVVERPRWDVRVAAHSLSRFVGRDAEMAMLETAARRARVGQGQVIIVSGEAGMGKSRLVHEFCASETIRGWRVLRVSAFSHDTGTPYRAADDMVRSWIGTTEGDDAAATEQKLTAACAAATERPDLDATALRALLDLPSDDPEWGRSDPQQRRQRIRDALLGLAVPNGASSPTLLVLEDMHWADTESLAVFNGIVSNVGEASVLVVATGRPEWRTSWDERSNCSLLHIGPLETEAAHNLISGFLSGSPELDVVRERLVQHTQANPLFLEEMAQALVESGVVVGDSVFRLTRHPDDIEIPESLQALLAARIDRLPTEQRELLQIAAVIGRRVPLVILRAIADLPEDVLRARLAALTAHEFLSGGSRIGDVDLTFKHALTHAAAYESMLLRHRRTLHVRVLHAIEAVAVDRIEAHIERLADHALRAELWDKAVQYLRRAGDAANALAAHRAAVPFFERALDAHARMERGPESDDIGIDLRLGLRVALASTADLPRARICLDEAERLAATAGDTRRLAHIRTSQCTVLTLLGMPLAAVKAGQLARNIATSGNDAGLRVDTAFALSQAYSFSGSFAAAARVLREDLPLLRGELRQQRPNTTGTSSVLFLAGLGITCALTGALVEAHEAAREACEIAAATQRPYDLTYASVSQGLALFTEGDITTAVLRLEEALGHCRSGEIDILLPSLARFLGPAYLADGRHEDARALLEEAVSTTRAKGLLSFQAWCGVWLGFALLAASQVARAAELCEEAISIARAGGLRTIEVYALRLTAALRVQQCKVAPEAALRAYGEALNLAERLGMRPEVARCRLERGLVSLQMGWTAEAENDIRTASEIFASHGMALPAQHALALLGDLPNGVAPTMRSAK